MKTAAVLRDDTAQRKPFSWRLLLILLPLGLLGSPAAALAQTYNQVQFTFTTGEADLRDYCSVTATLQSPTGASIQVATLKAVGQPGWPTYSTKTATATLATPLKSSQFGNIVITYKSQGSFNASADHWEVKTVSIALSNNGQGSVALVSGSGNPLKRFTMADPSLTLSPPTLPIVNDPKRR